MCIATALSETSVSGHAQFVSRLLLFVQHAVIVSTNSNCTNLLKKKILVILTVDLKEKTDFEEKGS